MLIFADMILLIITQNTVEMSQSFMIMSIYVRKTAKFFHDGKYDRAGYYLGIAIHIAQDLTLLWGSTGWHDITERDIEDFLKNVSDEFVSECVKQRDTRHYTITVENIVCKAYAVIAGTFERFHDE